MKKVLILLLPLITQILAKEPPDFLKICKRSDPKLQECIKDSIVSLQPNLVKGIPELKVPSLEPLVLKEPLTLNPTKDLKVLIKNLKLHGCSNFDLTHFYFDPETNKFNFTVNLPYLYITGKYDHSGRLLFIPVEGTGKFIANFTDTVGRCEMDGEVVQKDDGKYMTVKKLTLKLSVEGGTMKMIDLFGKDSLFGNVVNTVINDNFNIVVPEFLVPSEREFSAYFQNLMNKIFESYTYDQLFPLK